MLLGFDKCLKNRFKITQGNLRPLNPGAFHQNVIMFAEHFAHFSHSPTHYSEHDDANARSPWRKGGNILVASIALMFCILMSGAETRPPLPPSLPLWGELWGIVPALLSVKMWGICFGRWDSSAALFSWNEAERDKRLQLRRWVVALKVERRRTGGEREFWSHGEEHGAGGADDSDIRDGPWQFETGASFVKYDLRGKSAQLQGNIIK